MCQLNWWIPIYPLDPDNAMGFYPRYFSEAVRNNSEIYNYYVWNTKSRATAAQHVKTDTREQPKAQEDLQPVTMRYLPPPGGVIIFSGAQLHETVPNTTNVARYSLDFRTVHLDDVLRLRGAQNIDSHCTGTTMRDYLRASDLSQLPEEAIALYDDETSKEDRVLSVALAGQSAGLVLMGRDESKLRTSAEQLLSTTSTVELCVCDLTKDSQIEGAATHIAEKYGRLDILVHCAGIIDHGNLADAPMTSLDRQYISNVRGPLLLTQRLLPLLKKPRGQIVFVNSSAGLNARPNTGQFSATQHAFKALADALREEVNNLGIRVSTVFPGRTATSRISALCAKEGREFMPDLLLQPEDVASVVLHVLTLPWTAEVTNVSIRPMLKSY